MLETGMVVLEGRLKELKIIMNTTNCCEEWSVFPTGQKMAALNLAVKGPPQSTIGDQPQI